MATTGPLLQTRNRVREVDEERPPAESEVVATRDHALIRRWAAQHQAEPATGEATNTGPATVDINDGGAGIRFNFPGSGAYRPITWEEWFQNFEQHGLTFVYEHDANDPARSTRYRLVTKEGLE
jgi:hypothetical protein